MRGSTIIYNSRSNGVLHTYVSERYRRESLCDGFGNLPTSPVGGERKLAGGKSAPAPCIGSDSLSGV